MTRPLRILHVIQTMDPRSGGPAETLRRHAELRATLGATTTVATLGDPASAPAVAGARIIALGRGIGPLGYRPGMAGSLAELAVDHDVAVVNGLWGWHAVASHAAFAGRIPYAVFPHGMLDPWFNRTHPLKALRKRLWWRFAEYRLLRDAAAVCFTSEAERLLARGSFRPYRAREAVVAYGTADPPAADDTQSAAFRLACPALGGRSFILFLSRIHPKKGCDLLVRAFAAIAGRDPHLHLVLAGPDPDRLLPGLLDEARRLGVGDRVHAPGMLEGAAKWGAIRSADAFCLPSHQENFGVAVAEALACGTPVLISDQVNIWREIDAHGAGLIEPDDEAGTARLLGRWLDHRPQREAMSAAAQRCFRECFHISRSVADVLELLGGIRDGRHPEAFSA